MVTALAMVMLPVGCSSTSKHPKARTATTLAGPVVDTVTPSHGPLGGGQTIKITGSGFASGDLVLIEQGAHGLPLFAKDVHAVSATELTAVTPPSDLPGAWRITVEWSGGATGLPVGGVYSYDYPRPTISKITPPSGPVSGGQTITVTGYGFLKGARVAIAAGGRHPISLTDVQVISMTQLTAVTGAAPRPGSWRLTVSTAGGTSPSSPGDVYTFQG